MGDKNCLSYWFPLLQAAGLPVPRTTIISTECELLHILDGKTPEGFADLVESIRTAADAIGWPIFLRTGQTSAKHNWRNTCYVPTPGNVPQHVCGIVEFSAMADFMGLPTDVWAVREMLPTRPVMTLSGYGDMPLVREFRCFVKDAEILCVHPYWTRASVIQGLPLDVQSGESIDWKSGPEQTMPMNFDQMYEALCRLDSDDEDAVRGLAAAAGKAVGGEWSVDMINTDRGWFLTDMAIAAQSFHWPGCEAAQTKEE